MQLYMCHAFVLVCRNVYQDPFLATAYAAERYQVSAPPLQGAPTLPPHCPQPRQGLQPPSS